MKCDEYVFFIFLMTLPHVVWDLYEGGSEHSKEVNDFTCFLIVLIDTHCPKMSAWGKKAKKHARAHTQSLEPHKGPSNNKIELNKNWKIVSK